RPRPPNRAGRKKRISRPWRAAARFRAGRDRRRGQARSASHRKSPKRGPRPSSKYTASKPPPKAKVQLKPLILINDPSSPKTGPADHHNGFCDGGKRGMVVNWVISMSRGDLNV